MRLFLSQLFTLTGGYVNTFARKPFKGTKIMRKSILLLSLIFIMGISFAQTRKVAQPTLVIISQVKQTIKVSEMQTVTPEEWQKMIKDAKRKLKDSEREKMKKYSYPQQHDQVMQDSMPASRGSNSPLLTFEGGVSPYYPSDANGSVDSNYYVQTINKTFSIYDKNGTLKAGPIALNSLFNGLPGSTYNDGDPIVLFDDRANRWLITEMSKSGNNDYLMMAVSQSSNPLGAWYAYSFDVDDWPDYPKYGIWRDAYYIGVDKIDNNTEEQEDVFAVEREKMLSGQTAKMVGFLNPDRPNTTYSIAAPVDNDGTFAPTNSPGLFVTFNYSQWNSIKDQLWIYEMHIDWNNISNSTFSRTVALDVASLSLGSGPTQPGGYTLDGLSWYIMNKPVYRNFGSHQVLVCCHTVDGSATVNTGIRWYELMKTEGEWEIRQQGTYSPDNDSRWVGSITMNSNHRIALGYSITGNSTFPGIRYAAQSPTAYASANGLLDIAEETILNGSSLQSNSSRWGDYSNISVDPSNDTVFWYTNQYVGNSGRSTKISKFKFGHLGLSAGFIANTKRSYVNEIVKFDDISYGNPTTWSWSFNPSTVTYAGGTNSSSQNPWVQFSNHGTYSVTLTIGDGNASNSITRASFITIDSACIVANFPWIEDFENGGNIPGCWTQEYVNIYNEDWQFVTGDNGATGYHNSAHSGTYNAYFNKAGAFTRLFLPKLELASLTKPQIDFWYTQDGSFPDGHTEFKVLYKGSESANWIVIKTYSTRQTSWTQDSIVMPYNTNNSYIAFESSINDGGYGILIDDITVKQSTVICEPPLGQESNTRDTSAVVAWIAQLYSPTWQLEYGSAGFILGSGTFVNNISDTSYTITGLSPNTSYDWYVRKNCGSGSYSNWTGPFTFKTTKTPLSFPVSENFENGFVSFVNASGNNVDFTLNGSIYHGGTKSAQNQYSQLNTNYLIMSSFVDISSISYPVLTFWHIAKTEGNGDYCKVQISTDAGSSWRTLPTSSYQGNANNYSAYQRFELNSYTAWSASPVDNTMWKKEKFVLDNFKSDKVMVRFKVYSSNYASYGWYIDDVLIEDETCPGIYPDSLFTSTIQATSAQLRWTEKGPATSWDIEYGLTGFTQGSGTTISGTASNPYTLNYLTVVTTYDWYVRSSCGGGNYSDWSGPETFSTTCNPSALPYFEDFENVSIPAMPQCFTVQDANNDGTTWQTNYFSAFSGSNSAGIATPSGKSSDDWLFTPGFTLQAGVSYQIAFVYATVGGHESVELKYGDYPDKNSMYSTAIWYDDDIISWSWTMGYANVTPSTAKTYYFGFHGINPINTSGFNIDDIYINVNSDSAVWTGSNSNDWYTAANWNNDTIPTTQTEISITATATNFPTVNKLSLAKNVTLESSSSGNASLLGEKMLKISGQFIVKQFLTAGKWHLISAPVKNAVTGDLFLNNNPDIWLQEYFEPDDTWGYITSLTRAMYPGEGFLVWVETGRDTTVTFSGEATSDNLYLDPWSPPQLHFTSSAHGYNLVGNPYISALDWDNQGWDTTGIDGSIWVWNQASGNYAYRNSQGQGSLTNGIIPRTQGFFIRANDPDTYFTIPLSARVHSNQPYYKKSDAELELPYIIVDVSMNDKSDEVWVSFDDSNTEYYVSGKDVYKLNSGKNSPQLWFNHNQNELSILAVPILYNDTRIENLNFKAGETGLHRLLLKKINLMQNFDIYLEDLKLDKTIDFKKEPVYNFEATSYQNPDRFKLHFTNHTADVNIKSKYNKSIIYSSKNKIYINRSKKNNGTMAKIVLLDLLGRKIRDIQSTDRFIKIYVNIHNTFIFVKLTENNTVTTKKVFVE